MVERADHILPGCVEGGNSIHLPVRQRLRKDVCRIIGGLRPAIVLEVHGAVITAKPAKRIVLVELEHGSRRQHEIEDRRTEIAVGDLSLLQQPGDQLLYVGLVEVNWLCFVDHEQRPRIAGQIDAAVKVLLDDIV